MDVSGGTTFAYHKPLIQTKLPPGRGGASVCYADGKLILFGGHFYAGDDKFEYLDETWILDREVGMAQGGLLRTTSRRTIWALGTYCRKQDVCDRWKGC